VNKMELWKDITSYEGSYWVSNFGRVKSCRKVLKCYCNGKYVQVMLGRKGKQPLIHRLVAEAFIPNPENKPQVNHIDGNKLNNNVDNLEWCTCAENMIHCVNLLGKKGNPPHYSGEKNPAAKLSNEDVIDIRNKLSSRITNKQISNEYNISNTTVWKIKTYQTYKSSA
jgi:hypothetical protein